jgi:hypothetical protein
MPFPEFDISSWRPEGHEPLGTKRKLWWVDPDTETDWLFKYATFNRNADGSVYLKGDDWAERIATALAVEIGLPVAVAELALVHADGAVEYGIISQKVLSPDESLVHGNELLAETGVVGVHAKDRRGYRLEAVRTVLEPVEPPLVGNLTAWECFVGYLVLDALIANTDRHQENWAVVQRDGKRRLAPTFDHASSMGFQLSDEERTERLETRDRGRQIPAFAARARSRFEGNPHPCDVAAEALTMVPTAVREHWLGRCAGIESLGPIVGRVPAHRMSDPARRFAEGLYASNRARMLSHPPDTVSV